MNYGKIEYLYSGGVAETIVYDNKIIFEKEIHDSLEIGRPIRFSFINLEEQEHER